MPAHGGPPKPRRRSHARVTRRWCIPTAILRSPNETLNGISILDEIPDSVGLVLWLTLDDLTLWADAPAHERAKLLGLCSVQRLAALVPAVRLAGSDPLGDSAPAELRYRLDVLSAMLADPGEADAEMLGRTCLAISAWAVREKSQRTALAFAQVGALAAPMLPEACVKTASCALAVGEPLRAETWLRRGIALGRRIKDWDTYAAAYVSLGALQLRQERFTEAEKSLSVAYRTARRNSISLVRRNAAYGLMQLALRHAESALDVERREVHLRRADELALAAARACDVEQPDPVPVLLAVARHGIVRGNAAIARGTLARLRTIRPMAPEDALAASAMTARAAALAGERRASKSADARAWEMLAAPSISEPAAFVAAMDLAHGAAIRRDAPSLDRATRAVLRLAPATEYEATVQLVASLAGTLRRESEAKK